jgi:hypothetical protein
VQLVVIVTSVKRQRIRRIRYASLERLFVPIKKGLGKIPKPF